MVELRGVTCGYGDRIILQDISLVVPKGKVVALMGTSGGGKTTVLRMIAGFLAPDSGDVLIGGSGDDALIGDHDNAVLRETSAQLRRTDSADSLGARPGGMFTLDSSPHLKWHAERFEEPWNGWATPVVTRQTLENLFADLADGDDSPCAVQEDGRVLVYMPDYEDGDYFIEPDGDGLYHLAELGWTFDQLD